MTMSKVGDVGQRCQLRSQYNVGNHVHFWLPTLGIVNLQPHYARYFAVESRGKGVEALCYYYTMATPVGFVSGPGLSASRSRRWCFFSRIRQTTRKQKLFRQDAAHVSMFCMGQPLVFSDPNTTHKVAGKMPTFIASLL